MKNRIKKSLLALWMLSLAGMLTGLSGCNEKDEWGATVKGLVLDNESEAPVDAVSILFMPGNYETVTEADGSFVMENLPAANYTVRIEKEGFVRTEKDMAVITAGTSEVTLRIINKASEFDIADAVFQNYLTQTYDADGDGKLSYGEAEGINRIDCSNLGIQDIPEIERLYELNTLRCDDNKLLERLILGKNRKLDTLSCNNTSMLALDVTKADSLRALSFNHTRVDKIDLSKNSALTYFSACNNGKLTEVSFSKNKRLREIYCSGSPIKTLSLSSCDSLEVFHCDSTAISSLSLSRQKYLRELSCSKTALNSLTLSADSALQRLNCSYTNIYKLDVSQNSELIELDCSFTHLKSIQVHANTKLQTLKVIGIPQFDNEKLKIIVSAEQMNNLKVEGNDNFQLVLYEEPKPQDSTPDKE